MIPNLNSIFHSVKYTHVSRKMSWISADVFLYIFPVFFDGDYILDVNTTSCQMIWQKKTYQGVLDNRTYNSMSYTVCVVAFDASVYIAKDVRVHLHGKHPLLLASNKGDINLHSNLTVNNSNKASLGGYDVNNEGN